MYDIKETFRANSVPEALELYCGRIPAPYRSAAERM